MAELLLGNPLDSFNKGQAQGKENLFNRLAGQAATAPQDQQTDLLNQAIQTDPTQGLALKGTLDQFQQAHAKKVANVANYVLQAYKTGNPAQVEGAYQAVKPFLAQIGSAIGQQPADHFTPEMLPNLYRIVGEAGGDTAINGQAPTAFRDFQMKAQAAGLQPGTPEYENAAKIALGQEGRASNAGMKFGQFTGADGRERVTRQNPRTGAYEVYNEQTGQFDPLGGSPQVAPQAGSQAGPQAPQITDISYQGANGAPANPMVSEANAWLSKGVPPDRIAAAMNAKYKGQFGGRIASLVLGNDGQFRAGTSGGVVDPAAVPQAAPPGLGVGRPAEEQAGAVQNAKNASDLAYLPQTEAVKASAAVQQAGQTVTSKGLAERELDRPQATAALSDANNGLDRLASTARAVMNHPGLNGITSWKSKIPDLPGSEAADARAELETLKSQIGFSVLAAMRAASKTGGALGSISDAEGERLNNNLAALQNSQSPEAFKANLQKIVDYTQSAKSRLATAYTQTYHAQGQGDSDVPQAVAPTAAPKTGDYSHLWN